MRADRLTGLTPLRDLDSATMGRAIAMLEEADTHGGLLALAVAQLRANYVAACGPAQRRTWYGWVSEGHAREAWPRWTGELPIPFDPGSSDPAWKPARRYAETIRDTVSQTVAQPPAGTQGDAASRLSRRLPALALPQRVPAYTPEPLFAVWPAVSAEALRALVRLVAGVEDYPVDQAGKATLLACLVNRGELFGENEWHAMLEWPLHVVAECGVGSRAHAVPRKV